MPCPLFTTPFSTSATVGLSDAHSTVSPSGNEGETRDSGQRADPDSGEEQDAPPGAEYCKVELSWTWDVGRKNTSKRSKRCLTDAKARRDDALALSTVERACLARKICSNSLVPSAV